MNAIVNGKLLLPDREVTGQALLFDQKILGISDEEVREMNKEKAWVEPEPQPQPEPEPEWAYPSFTEEDVQQMDQRGSMVRDEDL